MSKPLVVYGPLDGPHLAEMRPQSRGQLDFASVGEALRYRAPVVYMRTGHEMTSADLTQGLRVEKQFRQRGALIVNSMMNRITCQCKDVYYAKLQEKGIGVPFFIPQPTMEMLRLAFEAGQLRYPFLLRTTAGSGGKGMRLISNEGDLRAEHAALAHSGVRFMAAELIPAKDGRWFKKHRAVVFGGKVDLWGTGIGPMWNVQSTMAGVTFAEMRKANEANDKLRALDSTVVRAGRMLGCEIYAVDVVVNPASKRAVIVDFNPTYVYASLAREFFPQAQAAWRWGHFDRVTRWLCSLARGRRG